MTIEHPIRSLIQNPTTGRTLTSVYVVDNGWYTWNDSYRAYFHHETGARLIKFQTREIDFAKEL